MAAADRAVAAAASVDVLTATTEAEAIEAAERAVRRGLKAKATDLALRLVVAKLERTEEGGGRLEDLVAVAVRLDPDGEGRGGGGSLAVEVVVRRE